LLWLFVETFEPENIAGNSFLDVIYYNQSHANLSKLVLIEVGPRLAFTTAWSSNCVSMCQACGVANVTRIERSRRYFVESSEILSPYAISTFTSLVHDRMTECVYPTPLTSFFNGVVPEPVKTIPVLSEGKEALKKLNDSKGLGFDDWDLEFYTNMFTETLKRDPTDVECFDLAQSNSEHSRHWFFSGNMIIDNEAKKESLFAMVKSTLPKDSNSIIAFHDNSSVSTISTSSSLTRCIKLTEF
jgi:phosphoribosylformylglycinamidine synthase